MELREYLTQTVSKKTKRRMTMAEFGESIGVAQSIVSRLCARLHRPDPNTAIKIVVATRGEISLDDLYQTPAKWRADRKQ